MGRVSEEVFMLLAGFGSGVFLGAGIAALLDLKPGGRAANTCCWFFGFLGASFFVWQFT